MKMWMITMMLLMVSGETERRTMVVSLLFTVVAVVFVDKDCAQRRGTPLLFLRLVIYNNDLSIVNGITMIIRESRCGDNSIVCGNRGKSRIAHFARKSATNKVTFITVVIRIINFCSDCGVDEGML